MRFLMSFAVFLTFGTASFGFETVKTRAEFIEIVGTKSLKIRLYGLTLKVRDSGLITGRALGADITGDWAWKDGYFCRTMDWSGYDIEYNCQLVEATNDKIRFTVDKGAGKDATLRITD